MAANNIIYCGDTDVLVEHKTSPQWEFGEKVTCNRIYEGLFPLCLSSALPKGTLGTGEMDGYIVSKSLATKLGNGYGRLTITFEAGAETSGQQLPPDEYDLDPFELNPRIETNPYFTGFPVGTFDNVAVALNAVDREEKEKALTAIDPFVETVKLYELKRKGTDNWYLAGFVYSWTLAFWEKPAVNRGGYIEAPYGPLGDIIDELGMSSLRAADRLIFTGQYHKLTRRWLCAPDAHWDSVIYAP